MDVRPQKGQLRDYFFEGLDTGKLPVLMPEGELDIIPFAGGKISVGASHENDKGFDLTVDEAVLEGLEEEAKIYFPDLSTAKSFSERDVYKRQVQEFEHELSLILLKEQEPRQLFFQRWIGGGEK